MNAALCIKMKFSALLILLSLFSVSAYTEGRSELWSDGREALAVCEINAQNLCYVVIGKLKIDVTQAEHSNLGKLGIRKKEEYETVISYPSKWLTANAPEYMVQITTQAWLNGKRHTVSEPVYIKNGIYLQR